MAEKPVMQSTKYRIGFRNLIKTMELHMVEMIIFFALNLIIIGWSDQLIDYKKELCNFQSEDKNILISMNYGIYMIPDGGT